MNIFAGIVASVFFLFFVVWPSYTWYQGKRTRQIEAAKLAKSNQHLIAMIQEKAAVIAAKPITKQDKWQELLQAVRKWHCFIDSKEGVVKIPQLRGGFISVKVEL